MHTALAAVGSQSVLLWSGIKKQLVALSLRHALLVQAVLKQQEQLLSSQRQLAARLPVDSSNPPYNSVKLMVAACTGIGAVTGLAVAAGALFLWTAKR